MRILLRSGAALLAAGVIAFWFFGGPNTGWTKTYVERKVKDPVTELDQIVQEKRFIPGVDFLGEWLLGAALLFGLSFLFKRKSKTIPNPN